MLASLVVYCVLVNLMTRRSCLVQTRLACSYTGVSLDILDDLLVILLVLHLFVHLVKALGVSCADEVSLHVVDAAIGVHQVLVILALDLDDFHDDSIDHVD